METHRQQHRSGTRHCSADLVRDIEPTPLRTMVGWLKTGFPEIPPGGGRTVLVGGLQTVIETMMQTQTPDAVADWLRQNALATVRAWKSHWPNVGLVFVMDGPGSLFEYNVGDELIYFGRGKDRDEEGEIFARDLERRASGAGAYQVLVPDTNEIGGYFVRWLS